MKESIIKSLFEEDYIYPTIIYNLVKNGNLDHYIKYLENNNIDVIIKNKKISYYKNFLKLLDNFIDFFDCSLNINHSQILNILENILSNKTYKVFLKKIDIKENAYINKIIIEYKKIILYPFRQNLKYIINNNKEINMMFHFLNINLNDDRELYNFLIECCNIRKNHQYILFDDFNEYLDNKNMFYIYMWKILFVNFQNTIF